MMTITQPFTQSETYINYYYNDYHCQKMRRVLSTPSTQKLLNTRLLRFTDLFGKTFFRWPEGRREKNLKSTRLKKKLDKNVTLS